MWNSPWRCSRPPAGCGTSRPGSTRNAHNSEGWEPDQSARGGGEHDFRMSRTPGEMNSETSTSPAPGTGAGIGEIAAPSSRDPVVVARYLCDAYARGIDFDFDRID